MATGPQRINQLLQQDMEPRTDGDNDASNSVEIAMNHDSNRDNEHLHGQQRNWQMSHIRLSAGAIDASRHRQQEAIDSSMSWSEQLFFSQDDEDITVCDEDSCSFDDDDGNVINDFYPKCVINANGNARTEEGNLGDDDTCNDTIAEKTRQRSKKASRASTVGAFVTFSKALFGIGMLSNPAVLGEVGLVLGTFCHLFIVVGCAFACYLLLTARKLAKEEVKYKEMRKVEKQEEYLKWRRKVEERKWCGKQQYQQQPLRKIQGATSSESGEERLIAPLSMERIATPMLHSTAVGWGRCQESLQHGR